MISLTQVSDTVDLRTGRRILQVTLRGPARSILLEVTPAQAEAIFGLVAQTEEDTEDPKTPRNTEVAHSGGQEEWLVEDDDGEVLPPLKAENFRVFESAEDDD